jgi:hypothetical protein
MAQYYLNIKNESNLVHIPKFHIVKECLAYLQTMLLVPLRLQIFNPNIKKTLSFINHDWKVLCIICSFDAYFESLSILLGEELTWPIMVWFSSELVLERKIYSWLCNQIWHVQQVYDTNKHMTHE